MPETKHKLNLNGEALRKLLVTWVNVGEKATPVWEALGYKTEDSAVELNPDITTVTDVLGQTYTDINKMERKQTFDPNTLVSGKKVNEILLNMLIAEDLGKFSNYECMLVHGYLGDPGSFVAEKYDACTIIPQSLGGSSRVDFPIEINYGGEKEVGTVDKLTAGLVFTAEEII